MLIRLPGLRIWEGVGVLTRAVVVEVEKDCPDVSLLMLMLMLHK